MFVLTDDENRFDECVQNIWIATPRSRWIRWNSYRTTRKRTALWMEAEDWESIQQFLIGVEPFACSASIGIDWMLDGVRPRYWTAGRKGPRAMEVRECQMSPRFPIWRVGGATVTVTAADVDEARDRMFILGHILHT